MSDIAAPEPKQPPRLIRAFKALGDRRMAAMILMALGASLPYGAVVGVLTAWLTKEGVQPETLGVLALVPMGYAFKYLWAPAFQKGRRVLPVFPIGGRRQWLILLQASIAVLLCILAVSNPAHNIGLVALITLAITLLSPTHDLILDAWRIEVARSDEDKDLMAALYQFGYKFGGFISGFIALLMAARVGWIAAYIMIAAFMFLSVAGSLLAPDPVISKRQINERISFLPSIPSSVALPSVLFIMAGWALSFFLIGSFVYRALVLNEGPISFNKISDFSLLASSAMHTDLMEACIVPLKRASGKVFVTSQGPLIVGLTVLLPALMSAYLIWKYKATPQSTATSQPGNPLIESLTRTMFRAIFDPLMELISRMKWGVILVLLLALTYRFTDAVWGSFAYAFYLGENFGALGYTLDDVAIASKFFGVLATILGTALGAVLIASIGRMPVLFLGAVIAAATNLLYADLAAGAGTLDAFLAFSHLDAPLIAFADWAAALQPEEIILPPDQGQRMARLMITIFAENIAGGLALVAILAYLTSVVNPRFAAVQYALLASLTMLIGTLGKPWIGTMMETKGFYTVFIVTFWLGGIAVVLSILEWIRQHYSGANDTSLVFSNDTD